MKGMANNNASAIFENFLNKIVNLVNYNRGRAKKHRMFMKLCEGMEASYKRLLFYVGLEEEEFSIECLN